MSMESDLLFPHSDPLIFPDFGQLTEFEDFTKDLVLSNSIDGITAGEFLEELDCKDDLKPLLMPELHAFSTTSLQSSRGVEKPDSQASKSYDNLFTSFIHGSSQPTAFASTNSCSKLGMQTFDCPRNGHRELINVISGELSPGQAEQVEILSPRTLTATNKMNCMSLKEMGKGGLNLESAVRPFSPLSPLGQVARTRSLPLSSAEPSLQSLSPVSSPSSTITTSDGSCARANVTTTGVANGLLHRTFAHEENSNIHLSNCSIGHTVDLSLVSECSAIFGRQSPRPDASGNCRGPIPPHVMQEASHLPSMQRSYSSHALGQFRFGGHTGPGVEDFSLSPRSGIEMSTRGFSNLGPYTHYHQPSDSQGSAESSPIASMRRVYSTGDLQAFNGMQFGYGCNSPNPLEHINVEEAGSLKIGHYTPEERKMKLHRYRQKRTERNFNKKIKYACRKNLADSRPRIRGRFARTDDTGESLMKENGSHHDEDYEEGDGLVLLDDKFMISNSNGASCWNFVGN